jgi:chromosome segregation ATPase
METPAQELSPLTKTIKMTPKQILKAEEQSKKYLQQQKEYLEEFKRMIDNKELTIVDMVKSVKSYRKILESRNRASKIHYEEIQKARDETKKYYNNIKDKVEAYKEELLKAEMEKINKEVLDLSNNLVVSERPVKTYKKK